MESIAAPVAIDLLGSPNSDLDTEENLITAVQQIMHALTLKKTLTNESRKVLADLGLKLSTIKSDSNLELVTETVEITKINAQIELTSDKISKIESDIGMIWDSGHFYFSEYLNLLTEAHHLVTESENLSSINQEQTSEPTPLNRASDLLHSSMARLEDEFVHILLQNRQPFEPERVSFRSSGEDTTDSFSSDESMEEMLQKARTVKSSDSFILDLVSTDVVPNLRRIAELMFISDHGWECSNAFISTRRQILNDCLLDLDIQKLSIEEVVNMEWNSLYTKIKRWIWATNVLIRSYLPLEKSLYHHILSDLEETNTSSPSSSSSSSFVEATKTSVLQIINFGEAVAVGTHRPEKLFPILNMYELLTELLPEVEALYQFTSGSSIRAEFQELHTSLGSSIRSTVVDFEKAIASSKSTSAFAGGGVHHLTRYVMNYLRNLIDYTETLGFLLQEAGETEHPPPTTPLFFHMQHMAGVLEANLEEKGGMYKDEGLKHVFLLNNMRYMVKKVMDTELRGVMGDGWIRRYNQRVQMEAREYERCTWGRMLALLKDDGVGGGQRGVVGVKERVREFNLVFEEVYRVQTGWVVEDVQLRDDLRLSTSVKVVMGYRLFLGRHGKGINEKHFKYSADDLQNFFWDLFGGHQRSLPSSYRR